MTLAELKASLRLDPYIAGARVPSQGSELYTISNPADNQAIASVTLSGPEQVDEAVTAARQAFDNGPWPRMAGAERRKILFRFADAIEQHAQLLGTIESYDVGKLLSECTGHDVARAAANIRYFAGMIEQRQDECFWGTANFLGRPLQTMTVVNRQPVGVAALIVPWNSPLMLATWKIAPCLAAGNTCVIKPSPWAMLSVLQLGDLAEAAGLPPGVLNIISGGAAAGRALVSHHLVDRVSFTGSVATGKAVNQANAAARLAPISLELGGKAPSIVFEDADLELAVKGVARGSYRSQGQSCVAGSRLLLQQSIYEPFVERLIAEVQRMRIGSQLDPASEIGPLITRDHLANVQSRIEDAVRDGAVLRTGGRRPEEPALGQGNYLEPTIFEKVQPEMQLWQEEIFGPVLCVMPFKDEEEAIARANDTRYGLSASVWTASVERAMRVAGRVDAGMTWVNSHFLRDLRAPFGGFKESGIGSEGGRYSFEFYTRPKMVCVPYPEL